MPSSYLHMILSYKRLAEIEMPGEHRSAFLLGTIAPDAVFIRRDKRRTHYTVHMGIELRYRLTAFEQEFAHYRKHSTLHQRFYEGYRYHLLLDAAWMRECFYHAVLRMVTKSLTSSLNRQVAQYYSEMSRFDAFHRSSIEPHVLQDAYSYFAQADFGLLPRFLERDALSVVLESLLEEMQLVESRFEGQLLQTKNIERFLSRASRVPID